MRSVFYFILNDSDNLMIDLAHKFATILIALFNICFAVYIFNSKNKIDTNEKERDRKLQLLKTLVLDHSLGKFYQIFDNIEQLLQGLKQVNLTVQQKSVIDSNLENSFIELRSKFYDSLLAIDVNLYQSIKLQADDLQGHFSQVIFDPGVNLSHDPKFQELIASVLAARKTEIIRMLYTYRG